MEEQAMNPKDKLMNDLHMVIADAEEVLRLTANEVGDSAVSLRARLQARLDQAKEELKRAQHAVVIKAKAAGIATDEFVHENPWRAIGAAAGVGLVVGLLIGRR
jgi:ElaB/YqjD/DUF883 family membrane-anchored ribosome-binding protein